MNHTLQQWLTQRFNLDTHETQIKTEILAGISTFLTMSYIVFINPSILATTGMDKGAVFTATCLVTIVGSFLSGILANNPIAIAPGMALNTFFAFMVVGSHGFSWQQALGMVFISGVCFTALSLTSFRRKLVEALPTNIKHAILIGISLFIALIALKNSGLVIADPNTLLKLGDLSHHASLYFMLGFLLILVLDYYQVPGPILISICFITLISIFTGQSTWHGFMSSPPSLSHTFLQLDLKGLWQLSALKQIIAFLLIALFDATGTFVGLLNQPLFSNKQNKTRRISRGLIADSIATTLSGLLGSSSTSPFIESSAGIQAGGRTGLTAIIVACCFLGCLFFYPLIQAIPDFAVSPALLYIACCMVKAFKYIEIDDITEFAPAVVIILLIPYSFSIADGIGLGLLIYCVLKLCTGQYRAVSPMLYLLSTMFLAYFFLMHKII